MAAAGKSIVLNLHYYHYYCLWLLQHSVVHIIFLFCIMQIGIIESLLGISDQSLEQQNCPRFIDVNKTHPMQICDDYALNGHEHFLASVKQAHGPVQLFSFCNSRKIFAEN